MTGTQGPAGLSAYEVAVHDGFSGTEAEWIASLKGATGLRGFTGATGPQGPAGPKGDTGPQGPVGARGAAGPQGPAGGSETPVTVNSKSGPNITLTAADVGADAAGAADAVATSAGTLYARKSSNLSDLTDAAAARTALGLTSAATASVGTTAGTLAAGDDARFTNARTPSGAASGDLSGTFPGPAVSKLAGVALGGSAAPGRTLTASSETGAAWADTDGSGPWIFNVASYGAVGDGQLVSDGAMTAGSAVLTCTTSSPFTAGDVGKVIMVKGAAPTGVSSLVTTISAVTDAGHITLGTAATTTVASAQVLWATDDTQAFIDAVADATAYGAAHGAAKVFIPATSAGRYYGIGGPLKTGGSTLGNAQIPIPPVAPTATKCNLTIEGAVNGAGVQHWQQLVPQLGGSTLVSFGVFATASAQTTSINAGGNPCVIGGPAQPGGYGTSAALFSNVLLTLKNFSILTTYSNYGLTYSAVDMSGLANGHVEDFAYGTTGTVPSGDFGNSNSFAIGLVPGLLMPADGNNDLCIIRNVTCHGGFTYGIFATEHSVVDSMRILYCWSAFCVVGTYFGSGGATHAVTAQQLSIEACVNVLYIVGVGSDGIGPFINITQLDTETSNPTFADNNTGTGLSKALGTVRLTGLYNPALITVTHPTGLKIIDGQQAQPIASVTADYTALRTDEVILADATAASMAVTLPDAANTALEYMVKKIDSSANTVTITPAAGQNIDGASTLVLSTQYEGRRIVPFGDNWHVIGSV